MTFSGWVHRRVELMWLTGRLTPDFKTIADFRKDNVMGIRNVCRRFVLLCRELKLFSQAVVAIDSSKFKAVNSRDCNFTPGKVDRRKQQIEQSIQRYSDALETADRTQPAEIEAKTERLREKIDTLREQMRRMDRIAEELKQQPDQQLPASLPYAPQTNRLLGRSCPASPLPLPLTKSMPFRISPNLSGGMP